MPEGKGEALARLIDALPPERREQVFTHTSWASNRSSSYERLEFLGDSVLELAIARALYDRFPEASEGRLAKIRAHVVSRHSCAAVARELGLGATLVARAQDVPEPELHRISLSRNVLAALLEAAIAAVYLEDGFEAVEPAVVDAFDGAHRVRAHRARRLEDRAPGGARAKRPRRPVRRARGRRPATRASVRLRRADRRRPARRRSRVDEEGGRAGSGGAGPRCPRRVVLR